MEGDEQMLTLVCLQVTVQVCVFAFDLLYADGQPLVKLPLRERRARMAAAFPSRWVAAGRHFA